MRCFGYIRVSGQSQLEGDGPKRQRAAIEKFCKEHLFEIDAFFEEQITGTSEAMDRPQFSEMVAQLDDPEIQGRVIVVERMDRLARDLMQSEMLLRECRKRNIRVYAADQGQLIDMASDGGDPTRILIRQIMGALAEWEKSMLVKKLRAAKLRTGKMGGSKPMGAYPGEQEVVDAIHLMRNKGYSWPQVVNGLCESGLKSRSGGEWNKDAVRYLFKHTKPTIQLLNERLDKCAEHITTT